jgi:quercetin dioxygenase-like cupin family protein
MKAFTVYRVKDAESFDTPEGVMTPLFVGEQVSIIKLSLPPKLTVPAHSHKSNIVAVVMKGRLEVLHGNERVVLEEGDAFFAPSNVALGISNPSQGITEILAVSHPPSYKSVEELKELLKSFARRG